MISTTILFDLQGMRSLWKLKINCRNYLKSTTSLGE